MKCQQCAQPFTPANRRGPAAKFCSASCKQKNYRKTHNAPEKSKPVNASIKKTRNATDQAEAETDLIYEASRTLATNGEVLLCAANGYFAMKIDDLNLSDTERKMAAAGDMTICLTERLEAR